MQEQENLAVEPEEETVSEQTAISEGDEPESGSEDAPETEVSKETEEELEAKRERRREEKRQKRERAKQRVKDLEAERDSLKSRLEAVTDVDQEPRIEDFDNDVEYGTAKAVWNIRKSDSERERDTITSETQRIEAERQQTVHENFTEMVADARDRFEDFDKVVFNERLPLSKEVTEMIVQSDLGADLAYHVASNPEKALELSTMNPVMAAMELGRIESTLKPAQPKRETKAPQPINPIKPQGSAGKSPVKMTEAEFRKWRESGGTL